MSAFARVLEGRLAFSGGGGAAFDAENSPSCDMEVVAVVGEHHGVRGAGRRGERGRKAKSLEGGVLRFVEGEIGPSELFLLGSY